MLLNREMKNKVALVTGGAGHVGREIILKLAEAGVNILILDKDIENALALANHIQNDFHVQVTVLHFNLLHKDSFSSVFAEIKALYGQLDYLVNVAAFYDDISGFGCHFEEESYDAWLNVMQVNVMAPFFLAQALTPLFKKAQVPAIVNVSSIYSIVGPDHRIYEGTDMTNPCSYSVSKAGLNQLTKWLSTVLAPHVRVNTVSPGGIERGQAPSFIEAYCGKTPLKRMCQNSEIADAIFFLLSPQSSYITGHNLVIDGGWTVW